MGKEPRNVDISKLLYPASTWVIPILIAITSHEAAHAFAAWKLGDDTALREGRVTFNPLKSRGPIRNDPRSGTSPPDRLSVLVRMGEAGASRLPPAEKSAP